MAKIIREANDPQEGRLVLHQVNQVSVNRTPKDVGDFRTAHIQAESIQSPNRSRLLDLYEDVWLDAYLTGIWQKRVSAATNREITFVDKSGKQVDALDTLMEMEEWEQLLTLIMDSKLWGLSGVNFLPGASFAWEEIPRKHILIEKALIKVHQSDQHGISYPGDPFVWVIGRKRDLGLMLKCSFHALIKKGNQADWGQYSEIFGQPIRVVKYDAFDDKTRIQLKEVLDETGSSLSLMIPKQADFEIMDGKSSNGDGQLQQRLKDACNTEMGIAILGNTETTGNENGGSNAKAMEQGRQQLEITKKDLRFLLSQLNDKRFLAVLKSYGYPVEGGKFVANKQFDPYEVKAQMEIVAMARNGGTPVDDDYVYEITGIPRPDDYNAQKAGKEREADAQTRAFKEPENAGKKPLKKDDPEDLTDGIWNRIRLKLADFFDPAP